MSQGVDDSERHTAQGRPLLAARIILAGQAITFMSMYLAAGALMPLLVSYRDHWGLSPVEVTAAFAVFAVGFLVTVISIGSLSDHVGRRPVLVGALMVQLSSDGVLLLAPDIRWVIAGRVMQGAAVGAATTAFTAALVELAPEGSKKLGTILGSTCLTGGVAVGSLLAGVAIQRTTSASAVVFGTLIAMTTLGIMVVALSPETSARTAGGLRSLLPKVAVPRAAAKEFGAAVPAIAAIWMLSSLSGGLAPSMMQSVFHVHSGLLNGVCGFVAPAASALAGLLSTRTNPRPQIVIGMCISIVGTIGIAAGASTGSVAVMFGGLAVGGVGFGASFAAALRLVLPLAAASRRAELASAIYLVSYLAFGAPVVIAGKMTDSFGIVRTVAGFSAACAVLAGLSLYAQHHLARVGSTDRAAHLEPENIVMMSATSVIGVEAPPPHPGPGLAISVVHTHPDSMSPTHLGTLINRVSHRPDGSQGW